jgi:hypothetical protein
MNGGGRTLEIAAEQKSQDGSTNDKVVSVAFLNKSIRSQ